MTTTRPYTYGGITTRRPTVIHPATSVAATDPPPRLEHHERSRIRAAIHRAKQLYPAPVAALIERDLESVEAFGFRFDRGGQTAALVHHLMTAPLPDTAA